MAARITVNLNAKGEFEIWLNPEGRDVLVKELQGLSETNDHFHLGPRPIGEVQVCGHDVGVVGDRCPGCIGKSLCFGHGGLLSFGHGGFLNVRDFASPPAGPVGPMLPESLSA
jgi:hypothetical protein